MHRHRKSLSETKHRLALWDMHPMKTPVKPASASPLGNLVIAAGYPGLTSRQRASQTE